MISGYINTQQDLVDLLNGCLSGKDGILDLFIGVDTVSLHLERGSIRGFRVGNFDEQWKNKRSMLLYHLSEFMVNPQSFFSFREGTSQETIYLEEPISVEELVLQLQLVYGELKRLSDRVITPFAVVKVLKPFSNSNLYNGRSVYNLLASSNRSLVEEIRFLHTLFAEGFLDINQFHHPESLRERAEVDYLMKDVEADRVNLITLLENFQLGKFTGLIKIRGNDFEFEMFYKKGKLSAIYPCSVEFFDLLMNPRGRTLVSVIRMGAELIDVLMLKHSREKTVSGLSVSLVEMSKTLIGMNVEKRTGLIILYSEGSRTYIMYGGGTLLGILKEGKDGIKLVNRIKHESSGWIDLVYYQPMDNVREVVDLFLLNVIYGIILRYAGHLNHSILSKFSSSDVLKQSEGTIAYRTRPKDREETFGFIQFLLELSHSVLGQERLEKELELALEPFRDVLKILNVEEYLNFR